jgi:hypothetical protein
MLVPVAPAPLDGAVWPYVRTVDGVNSSGTPDHWYVQRRERMFSTSIAM